MNDGWSSYMGNYVRATSLASILYFSSLIILGNVILLNLFLAIMLKEFEEDLDILDKENFPTSSDTTVS